MFRIRHGIFPEISDVVEILAVIHGRRLLDADERFS
jgi:hypothetical protein